MKVKFKTTKYEEANIDNKEVERIVLVTLARIYNVPIDAETNEEGELLCEVECSGSHYWTQEEKLRVATNKDYAILEIYKDIRAYFNES